MSARRIDTHCHIIPPEYAAWLDRSPLFGDRFPSWTREGALALFEQSGIETGILSVTVPGTWLGPGTDSKESAYWSRYVNEYCAGLVRDSPRQFGFFATLTLPDLDGAIDEASYSVRELGADGVTILANVGGVYLGDPGWDALLEALDRLRCVVFVHPNVLPAAPLPGISPGTVDFLTDTTRAAVNLVAHDCLRRYPNITFILSHGGGYVPYAAMRIASMLPAAPRRETEAERMAWGLTELRKFWFDTALTAGPALPTLLSFADPNRMTFGSDYPFAALSKSLHFTRHLDEASLDDGLRHAIARGNAEKLFPRLAG